MDEKKNTQAQDQPAESLYEDHVKGSNTGRGADQSRHDGNSHSS